MAQKDNNVAMTAATIPDEMHYLGVKKRPWGRYSVMIRDPGQKTRVWLGTFDTGEEAARAYDAAVRLFYGNKAATNFPEDNLQTAKKYLDKLHAHDNVNDDDNVNHIPLNHNLIVGSSSKPADDAARLPLPNQHPPPIEGYCLECTSRAGVILPDQTSIQGEAHMEPNLGLNHGPSGSS